MRTLRTLAISLSLLLCVLAQAQKNCATATYIQDLEKKDPTLSFRMAAIEKNLHQHISGQPVHSSEARELGSTIIHIPVVVHILYNGVGQDISDAQVKSQIEALNRDFRRRNADTLNTPAIFKSIAADVQIEFDLATADPDGYATSGIIHKPTKVFYWSMDDQIKMNAKGGDKAWDSRYYLNIWVGNMHTVLGYATMPGGAADMDGIVISNSVFGTINIGGAFNLGRTVVHEAGHWLNLHHIWGDEACGNDHVDDTPTQGTYTTGCPSGFRSSCNNGTTGDMYMNYMDFTNDACMNLFTQGQKERMRALFEAGGPRASILSSKGLSEPYMDKKIAEKNLNLSSGNIAFPNPCYQNLTVNLGASWIGKTIRIVSMNGIVLQTLSLDAAVKNIDVSRLHSGMYFITGENGTLQLKERFVKL